MDAIPLFRKKEVRDGFIQELVVWRLDKPVTGCRHLFKYRFYFGRDDGTCLVRYDNERGKGDHKHFMGKELPYIFRTLEAVFSDFNADINIILNGRSEP